MTRTETDPMASQTKWTGLGVSERERAAIHHAASLVGHTFRDGARLFTVESVADCRPSATGAVVIGSYRHDDGRTYAAGPFHNTAIWVDQLGERID